MIVLSNIIQTFNDIFNPKDIHDLDIDTHLTHLHNDFITTKREYNSIQKTITNLRDNSFRFLYDYQASAVFHRRFDFTISDLIPINNRYKGINTLLNKRFGYIMDSEFLELSKRQKFRRSEFNYNEVTQIDIANNPDIFDWNYIVFIDGYYIDNTRLIIEDEKTILVFHKDIEWDFELPNPDSNIRVTCLWIHNSTFKSGNLSPVPLEPHPNDWAYPANQMNPNGFVSYDKFPTSTKELCPISDIDYLGLVKEEGSKQRYNFIDTITEDNRLYIQRPWQIHYEHAPSKIIGLKYLHQAVYLSQNLKVNERIVASPGIFVTKQIDGYIFEIEPDDMPFAVENMLVFTDDAPNSKKMFCHDVNIELYYPNIYKLTGIQDHRDTTVLIYYYYDEDYLKYKDYTDLYYRFVADKVEALRNEEIPEYIKNYKPFEFHYNIGDYQHNYKFRDALEYKRDTLREAFKHNEEYMYEYFRQLIQSDEVVQYLDMKNIDLSEKLCNDNLEEGGYDTFKEPHYKFIFVYKGDIEYYSRKYYLDGMLYRPIHSDNYRLYNHEYKPLQTKDDYDLILGPKGGVEGMRFHDSCYEYLYIPARLVRPDSFLEIEKSRYFEFTHEFTPTLENNEIHYVHNSDAPQVRIDNIAIELMEPESRIKELVKEGLLLDRQVNNGAYINRKDFEIYIKDYRGDYIVTERGYHLVDDIKIKVLNPLLYNKKLRLKIFYGGNTVDRKVNRNVDMVFGAVIDHFANMSEDNPNYLKNAYDVKYYTRYDDRDIEDFWEVVSNWSDLNKRGEFNLSYKIRKELSEGTSGVGVKLYIHYEDGEEIIIDKSFDEIVNLVDEEFTEVKTKITLDKTRNIDDIKVSFKFIGNARGGVYIKDRKLEQGFRITGKTNSPEDFNTNNLISKNTCFLEDLDGWTTSSNVQVDKNIEFHGVFPVKFNEIKNLIDSYIESDLFVIEPESGKIIGSIFGTIPGRVEVKDDKFISVINEQGILGSNLYEVDNNGYKEYYSSYGTKLNMSDETYSEFFTELVDETGYNTLLYSNGETILVDNIDTEWNFIITFFDKNKEYITEISEEIIDVTHRKWVRFKTQAYDIPKNARYASMKVYNKNPILGWFALPQIEYGLGISTFTQSKDEINNKEISPYLGWKDLGSHFRIFINGRKTPQNCNYIRYIDNENSGDYPEIIVNTVIRRERGDSVVFDYSPLKLNQVYYKREIPINGVLDLKGIIKKPFDLRWYEMYLNGIRVNRNMIDILTATKIRFKPDAVIAILDEDRDGSESFEYGLKTIRNLEILERDFNQDDVFVLPLSETFGDKMYNDVKHNWDNIVIPDEEYDIDDDQWHEVDIEFTYFVYLHKTMFINPNINQLTPQIKRFFPTLLDETESILLIDPTRKFCPPIIGFFNPNDKNVK